MPERTGSRRRGTAVRRTLAATAALVLGAGLALAGATAANAVAMGVSIQATSPTTQASGATFTYQINLACAGTNAPSCNDAIVTVPLDSVVDMTGPGWAINVNGGSSVQSWVVDPIARTVVITMTPVVPAGTSQSIILSITPPNLTTVNGTTWSLLPSVSSTDANMTGTTAPDPAVGTATATVPLTVAKTSNGTFYREGENITYTLRATCPASKPVGSVYADSMTVADTLPAGLTFVSANPTPTTVGAAGELTWVYPDAASVPVSCGGTAPAAAGDTITVVATVGSVGTGGTDEFGPYENVPNSVTATAVPIGGGTPATATGSRTVVVLETGASEIPGTHSIGKSSAGPLNISTTGSDRRGTYPGRWLPNGDNSASPASVLDAAPATYTISPRIQYESFQYELRDKVPCMNNLNVATGVYTQNGGVCPDPAFHILGVRIDYSGAAPGGAYVPQYIDTAGNLLDMEPDVDGSGWAGWVIPVADIGQVSELVIPRDVSQQTRLGDNIRVYGYADEDTEDGQTLRNSASIQWYLGAAGAPTDSQVSTTTADIFILNAPQIGVTKTMSNVGAATGSQARVQLAATLFSPGTPTADLVIADLLPAATTLVTNPATITASLTRPGGAAIPLTAAELDIEVLSDFAPGQQLVRVTLPVAELPAEAGQFTLTLSALTVDKPVDPGVYTNTARVFYDAADLLPSCAAGTYNPNDDGSVRPTGDLPANCEASAVFRTVTSSSGQFQLSKTVQGDYDTTPQQFPAVGHVKLTDGLADYALNWQNTGAPTLESVVLYDIFPHVGDHGVSAAQATEARGSQFRPVLESVGAAPTGVTVAYSALADPCRPEVYPTQGACTDDWTTDPADLGGLDNVLAIRLTTSGEYVTGQGFSIGFQMSVPTINKDLIAWNSAAAFGQTTDGIALLPTESPKVGITASDDRFTLGKTVDTAAAEQGDLLTYTVTVGNTGTRTSVPTTITDALPPGLTFVSADNGGAYDPSSRVVTWAVPALARDTTLDLIVTATVDDLQVDDEIVNSVAIVNPAGYSVPIISSPCASSPDLSCARTVVPKSLLASAGMELPVFASVLGALALAAGAVLLRLRGRAKHRA